MKRKRCGRIVALAFLVVALPWLGAGCPDFLAATVPLVTTGVAQILGGLAAGVVANQLPPEDTGGDTGSTGGDIGGG